MNFNKQNILPTPILFLISLIIIVSICVGVDLYVVRNTPSVPSTTTSDTTLNQPNQVELSTSDINKLHDAIARSNYTDQTCYDVVTGLWFVHTPSRPELEEGYSYIDDDWNEGWQYSNNTAIESIELGNGTITITNADNLFNDNITPDIYGLNCKTHTPPSIAHAK